MSSLHRAVLRAMACGCLVACAVPALGRYASTLFVSYGIYDEGLMLYGAERVLDGAVPYRDFWTLYAPGQFYALAGLFAIFEPQVAVERIWSAVVLAAIVCATGLLAGGRQRPVAGVLGAVLAAVWLARHPMPGSPLPVALAFALASLLCLERARTSHSPAGLAGSGALCGLAMLFRHDLGAALLCTQVVRLLVRERDSEASLASRVRQAGGAYLLGLALTTLPPLLLLLYAVPAKTLLEALVIFPVAMFPDQRRLPFPDLDWAGMAFYAAPALLLLAVLRASWMWKAGSRLDPSWCSALGLGLLLLQQAAVRSDLNHMLPSTLLAIAVCCGMLADLGLAGRTRLAPRSLPAWLALALMLTGLGAAVIDPIRERLRATAQPLLTESRLARARGIRVPPPKRGYEELIEFVRKAVPPSERIFVGNTRHDMLYFNDVIFYFLSERESATAYHELHPGSATTEAVQSRIVRDLADVDTIVLASILSHEKNLSALSSGVTLLDDYIHRSYRVVYRGAGYQVLQRP